MVQKNIILKVLLSTIISFLIFVAVLFGVDPDRFEFFAFVPFYLSLFIFLAGLFFLLRYLIGRISKSESENDLYNFSVQSFLLASLAIGLLILQHTGHFNIVSLVIFFISIIFLEFIISKK